MDFPTPPPEPFFPLLNYQCETDYLSFVSDSYQFWIRFLKSQTMQMKRKKFLLILPKQFQNNSDDSQWKSVGIHLSEFTPSKILFTWDSKLNPNPESAFIFWQNKHDWLRICGKRNAQSLRYAWAASAGTTKGI